MKKKILTVLSVVVLTTSLTMASTKNSNLSDVIKLYKAGNYSECYFKLDNFVKNDPANPLAYYYLAMTSAQLGRAEEAIANYDKAIALIPQSNNLKRYAMKGKRCIETPDKCEDSLFDSIEDEFILNKRGPKSTDKVRSDFERLKIENFMREMNRKDEIDPSKFKEYKDFSSLPTNDEIVAALRVLQKAGLSDVLSNQYSDLSVLTGSSYQNPMLNMMGTSSMNPQLIQALLTNNMTQGF